MIIKFTLNNWNKFFDGSNKIATFRLHPRKIGHYEAISGNRFSMFRKLGELDIVKIEEKRFGTLTEQDAKDDGFNTLIELKKELIKLNGQLNSYVPIYKHWIENIKKS